MASVGWLEFPRPDRQGKPVLLRRTRAGREIRKTARRREGAIKIDHDAIRGIRFGDVEEASGSVCRITGRLVAKQDEVLRFPILLNDIQAILRTPPGENNGAG